MNEKGTLMPKMKTHSGSKKRFRVTGTGKIVRGKAYKSHIKTCLLYTSDAADEL